MTICQHLVISTTFFVLFIISTQADENGRHNLTPPPTTTNTHIPISEDIIITDRPCGSIDGDDCLFTSQPYKSPSTSPTQNNNGRNTITLTPTIYTTHTPTNIPTSFSAINDQDNSNILSLLPTVTSVNINTEYGRNVDATKTPTVNIQQIISTTALITNDKDPVPTLEPTYIPTIEPTINTINPSIYPSINPTINTETMDIIEINNSKQDTSNAAVVIIAVFLTMLIFALICCLICYFIGRSSSNKSTSIEMEMKTHIDIKTDTQIDRDTNKIYLESAIESNTVIVDSNNINNDEIIYNANTPGEEIDLMEQIIMGVVVDNIEQNMEQIQNKQEGKITDKNTVIILNNDNAHSPIHNNIENKIQFPDININQNKSEKAYPIHVTKNEKAYPMDNGNTKRDNFSVNVTKKGKAYPEDIVLNVTKKDKTYPMDDNDNDSKENDMYNVTRNGKAYPENIGNTKRDNYNINITAKDKAYPMNTPKIENKNLKTKGMDTALPMITCKGSDDDNY